MEQINLWQGSRPLAAMRLFIYAIWTFSMAAVHQLVRWVGLRHWGAAIAQLHLRGICFIMGVRLRLRGKPVATPCTLFVANHASYLDIIVIGAVVRGIFVAKSEVASWPVFGWMAKLNDTLFINRQKNAAEQEKQKIEQALRDGKRLIMFPEGTSSDGNRVLPFRSSMFAAVYSAMEDPAKVTVQPITVSYVLLDGVPMCRDGRPFFAWYGDMDLTPHLWEMAQLGIVTVVVEFHDPVTGAQFPDRKALAQHCEQTVRAGFLKAIGGYYSQLGGRRAHRKKIAA